MSEFHSRTPPETIDTVLHATGPAPRDCVSGCVGIDGRQLRLAKWQGNDTHPRRALT
jgi:hypothetical protein